MTISISIIKTDQSSKDALNMIFSSENLIACANYGGGVHCNPERTTLKINLWGKRGDEAVSENQCMLARIINVDSEPAAMFNIGKSGNTVIDRTQGIDHYVYEISGLMIRDKFIYNNEIAEAVKSFMSTCNVDAGYTKVFSTFLPTHPYQEDFLLSAGAIKLTSENINDKLGSNSLHPERFKFEGEQLQECSKWDANLGKISHEGWADSDPCVLWAEKTAFVFDIVGSHINITDEL